MNIVEKIVLDVPSIFLGGIAFIILIGGSFLYLKKGREKETKNEKLILYAYAGVLFSFAIMTLFILLGSVFIIETYRNYEFYGNINNINLYAEIFIKIGFFSFFLGALLFILAFEKIFKRTKYLLSNIGLLLILISMMFPIGTAYLIPYAYTFILFILVLIIYTNWSQIEYKVISSYILLGSVCIGWSAALIGVLMMYEKDLVPIWFIFLLICIGGIFMIFPIFIVIKDLSKSLIYSIIFNLPVIGMQIFFIFVLLNSDLPIYSITLTLVFTALYTFLLFSNLKSLRSYYSKTELSEEKESHINILGTFVRPQKLTEEEVSVSKEKRICLVCKNKLGGVMFMCSDCGAFYCSKCSRALANLENACWVCETPFDESKPVKLPEKKEEKIAIEGVDQKKTKKK